MPQTKCFIPTYFHISIKMNEHKWSKYRRFNFYSILDILVQCKLEIKTINHSYKQFSLVPLQHVFSNWGHNHFNAPAGLKTMQNLSNVISTTKKWVQELSDIIILDRLYRVQNRGVHNNVWHPPLVSKSWHSVARYISPGP